MNAKITLNIEGKGEIYRDYNIETVDDFFETPILEEMATTLLDTFEENATNYENN